MSIKKKMWGKTKKNENVELYTMKNDFLEVEVLNYGGVIRKISSYDKNENFQEIALNLGSINDYEERSPYFGAIVGRNAGRIAKGVLKINGEVYSLAKTNGENSLHGGVENFSKKIWDVKVIEKEEEDLLELTLKSKHLEEGFPGNVEAKVIYTLKNNELLIDYYATTDRDTYINMTNHTYFNLSGDFKEDVSNEYLELDCSKFMAVNEETLPIDIREVRNTALDFTKSKPIKEALESNDEQVKIVNQGIDHPFVIDHKNKNCVVLENKNNGRVLEVQTDQPTVVIYTGNYLYEVGRLSNDVECKKYMGICFETQNYADALNFMPGKVKLITKDNPYRQKTKFIFTIKK